MTDFRKGCHSELVEERRVEACPQWFDNLTMTPLLNEDCVVPYSNDVVERKKKGVPILSGRPLMYVSFVTT
jgi:hypothetical protein